MEEIYDIRTFDKNKIITSTRVFPVSRKKMFRAWSEAEHLKEWWGPKGFTNTFEIFDFKVGGHWKFMMHGPEKGNYPNEIVYLKIVEPQEIIWGRITNPKFQIHAIFHEIAENETRLIFNMLFESEKECKTVKQFAPEKNEENFNKLEAELQKM